MYTKQGNIFVYKKGLNPGEGNILWPKALLLLESGDLKAWNPCGEVQCRSVLTVYWSFVLWRKVHKHYSPIIPGG